MSADTVTDNTTADEDKIDRESWVAMGAMALAVFAIANDFTAMNVVLPTIENDLNTDLSTVQWVVSGYALVFGVLIVPGGRLADIYGRTRILYIGAGLFALFSLFGALAPNIYLLIGARGLMGVGAAMMWPAILGLIYAILPASKAGLAGGLVIGVAGIGNATGPIIAGALAEISWRYIFILNVPISLIAIVVTWRAVNVENPTERETIDYGGTALLSLSLVSLLGAMTIGPEIGWSSPIVFTPLVVSLVAMGGFVLRERAAGEGALIPPSVIENRRFMWACMAVLAMSPTFFATLLYLPQFFQKILGEGTLMAGVMLLPFVATFAAASFIETWLLNRIGMKAVLTIGAVCIFTAPFLFVLLLDETSTFTSLIPGMVVLGVGIGLFYSGVTTAALTALDPSKSSLAGGILYMFQIAGGAVGLGLTTAVFLAASSGEIDTGASEVGITLSSGEIADVQGVLAGTETSQQMLSAYPNETTQLTRVVRDAFISGMRWSFALDAALALIGLTIAALKVGGPLSRFGHDLPTETSATDEADTSDEAATVGTASTDPAVQSAEPAPTTPLNRRHRHGHRHTP
jgi:EmrB/QacA subfamily drug resistance transporter